MARFGTGADLARALGVTRQAVSKAEKDGRITRAASGKFDLDAAAIQFGLHTDVEQQRRANAQKLVPPPELPAGAVVPEDTNWNVRRSRAEALRAELELQELQGVLVRRDVQEREGRTLASSIVLQLESIPDRIAAEFGTDDAQRRKLRQRIREELDRVRQAFAGAHLVEAGNA